jgi:hypothetical protein
LEDCTEPMLISMKTFFSTKDMVMFLNSTKYISFEVEYIMKDYILI